MNRDASLREKEKRRPRGSDVVFASDMNVGPLMMPVGKAAPYAGSCYRTAREGPCGPSLASSA
jgi:hypothetical protein